MTKCHHLIGRFGCSGPVTGLYRSGSFSFQIFKMQKLKILRWGKTQNSFTAQLWRRVITADWSADCPEKAGAGCVAGDWEDERVPVNGGPRSGKRPAPGMCISAPLSASPWWKNSGWRALAAWRPSWRSSRRLPGWSGNETTAATPLLEYLETQASKQLLQFSHSMDDFIYTVFYCTMKFSWFSIIYHFFNSVISTLFWLYSLLMSAISPLSLSFYYLFTPFMNFNAFHIIWYLKTWLSFISIIFNNYNEIEYFYFFFVFLIIQLII